MTVSIRGAEKGILYILTGEKRVMGKRAVQLSKNGQNTAQSFGWKVHDRCSLYMKEVEQ